jgi:hypothetical protein
MPFTSRGLCRVVIHRRLRDLVRYTQTVAANASMRERLKAAQQERPPSPSPSPYPLP